MFALNDIALRVPVRLDCLYLPEASALAQPMADFSRAPYNLSDGSTVNTAPPTPNLAEAVFNSKLGNSSDNIFPAGLHLHWALPDALTIGRQEDRGGVQFPAVPNRWLVRRLSSDGQLQKSWIVESDFLHPCDQHDQPTFFSSNVWPNGRPITFPVHRRTLSNSKPGAAFRYLGRCLTLDAWLASGEPGDYLNQRTDGGYRFSKHALTALGYGEPTFAAYYPGCYSVFGFCDIDPDVDPLQRYEYQLVGWFNEPDLDPLQSAEFSGLADDAARYDALTKEYRWGVSDADKRGPFPDRSVYYASLTLTPAEVIGSPPSASNVEIAIANTGGEALSALLADKVAAQNSANKIIIEDQLEAMNLAPLLQGVELDYQAHFAQVRHRGGFKGVGGGTRWAVQGKRTQPSVASQAVQDRAPQPALPDAMAHALNRLNAAQEAYDMAQQEIAELRYQTFCDWHKLHNACYSNNQGLEYFRQQSTSLADFVAREPLAHLQAKITLAGTLVVTSAGCDATGTSSAHLDLRTNTLTPVTPPNDTLAVQVVLRLKQLIDGLIAAKLLDQFDITSQPADHFWSPREPVVLLSGPVAVSTPRHGEDGDLACTVLTLVGPPGSQAFLGNVASLKPEHTDPSIQTQTSPPWHPILLEWSVALNSVGAGRVPNSTLSDTLDYAQDFITASFNLAENAPGLAPITELPLLTRDTYEGRCVMTPSAGKLLDRNLRAYLTKATLADCCDSAASTEPDYLDRLISWYQSSQPAAFPPKDSDKLIWVKHQHPFTDRQKQDEGKVPVLLPLSDLLRWYVEKPVSGSNNTLRSSWDATRQAQDPLFSALRALSQLTGMNVLAQSLGGFNAALLTRVRAPQIPIADPISGPNQRQHQLTLDVAQAVGPHHPLAPMSAKVFSPFRTGELRLDQLRLIDTFGQHWSAPLAGARFISSNDMAGPDERPATTRLTTRLVPPARLNFRWLAALSEQGTVGEVEMNSAPGSSPICGWLLPNHLDHNLMVYDHTGLALGTIDSLATWTPAPGANPRISLSQIRNPFLRRLLRRLVADGAAPAADITLRQHFLHSFLATLDSALAAIEPADSAQHDALALLIGRPVAVVRARVDLQLLGQPTATVEASEASDANPSDVRPIELKKSARWRSFVDQDWSVLACDWGRYYGCSYQQVANQTCLFLSKPPPDYARTTHGFERVAVPLRLGEHQLLNDGLVGFWKETADGELDNVFHAPQTFDELEIPTDVLYRENCSTPCIRPRDAGSNDNLRLTLQDEPLALTLLVDPRGVVHATCGILPVAQLSIPSAYYADSLRRMGITFRVGPLLTDAEQLYAALPKEAGYSWSWMSRNDSTNWQETTSLADANEHAHFFAKPTLVEGWLKLTPKDDEKGS